MVEIEQDREQVDKVRGVVMREQEVTDFETKKVQSVAYEAQKDLDAALPQLEAATAALDTLSKFVCGKSSGFLLYDIQTPKKNFVDINITYHINVTQLIMQV